MNDLQVRPFDRVCFIHSRARNEKVVLVNVDLNARNPSVELQKSLCAVL